MLNFVYKVVIWHDGKGYTYWEACTAIFQEANELLRHDLELLGLKLDLKKSNPQNQTSNKSLFEFNDTFVDSIILTQSKVMNTSVKEPSITVQPEAIPIEEIKDNEKLLSQKSNLINEINSLEGLILDTQIEEEIISDSKPTTPPACSNSFMDDQFMLEAVEFFETDTKSKLKMPLKEKHLNTTVVSEDILAMCQLLENNSAKSSKLTKPAKQRRSIHFRKLFGDENDDQIEMEEKKIVQSMKKLDIVDKAFKRVEFLSNLEPYLRVLSASLTVVETLDEYKSFFGAIKPKSSLSIGLALEKHNNINPELKNEYDELFIAVDFEANTTLACYGLTICFDTEKLQKKIYFLLFKSDNVFRKFVKELFEREDLVKILFFTKEHYKQIHELFGVEIRQPCYDPIIADWILNQEASSIHQIKQKYCPGLSIPINADVRNCKSCYGCCAFKSAKSFQLDCMKVINRAFIECLIGVYCFEKIKLQLQLHNLWIYYAKIESEIVLITARIELCGMGLSVEELELKREQLVKTKREIEDKVNLVAKRAVNLNSSNEVASLLFDKLKLKPIVNETCKERFRSHHSTSKDILMQLSAQHELPKLIILWRKINHTLGNSIGPVERVINQLIIN